MKMSELPICLIKEREPNRTLHLQLGLFTATALRIFLTLKGVIMYPELLRVLLFVSVNLKSPLTLYFRISLATTTNQTMHSHNLASFAYGD